MNTPVRGGGKALTVDGESSLTEAEITLGVLTAIEENHAVTQRSIASGLGIALGLTNAYLKRCIKKGYVKVTQIPRNRYAYYVTPTGFAEKSRLTAFYLSQSFRFFREARGQCEEAFETCVARDWNRVVLVGVGDLGEIAYYCGRERPIELLGFLDPDHAEDSFLGPGRDARPRRSWRRPTRPSLPTCGPRRRRSISPPCIWRRIGSWRRAC